MVHGFKRPEHEEMKHLAVNRSVFTFPCAQVFQIHAARCSHFLVLRSFKSMHPSHSSGNYYLSWSGGVGIQESWVPVGGSLGIKVLLCAHGHGIGE